MTGKSNEAGMVDVCMVDGGRADDAFYTVKMSNVKPKQPKGRKKKEKDE